MRFTEYAAPTAALFSFNHPIGACPACRGLAASACRDCTMPRFLTHPKTLVGSAVKQWQTPSNAECQEELLKFARLRKVPVDVPFRDLSQKQRDWVIDGDPDYNKDEAHSWPRAPGIRRRRLFSLARIACLQDARPRSALLSIADYEICPKCHGTRFGPDTLLYRLNGLTLSDFYQMPVAKALLFVDSLISKGPKTKSLRSHDDCPRRSHALPPRLS